MRGLIAAAALAAAILPAAAGAVPPNSSVPLGSTRACFVVATPAAPATCNFVGAGSSDVGFGGVGTGTYTITHRKKVVHCLNGNVDSFVLTTVTDDSGSMSPYAGDYPVTWSSGIVYTVTLTGNGFLAIGGPGTPGQDMASDPAVGPAPGYSGAEDGTGGLTVGAAC